MYILFYAFDYSFFVLTIGFLLVFLSWILFFFLFWEFAVQYFHQLIGFLILIFSFWVLVFVSSNLKKPEETKPYLTIEDYETLQKIRYNHTFYGTIKIQKVLYPGMYVTELQIEQIKVYKNKAKQKFNLDNYKNKILFAAVQAPKKDLWQGCVLKVQFYGKVFFRKLEAKNAFFEYLLNQNTEYFFKILENNIKHTECPQTFSNQARENILKIINNSILTQKQKQIALGLLLGNSNWMDKIYKEEIKKLGLMHLFAASGLHLGILFFVIYFPFNKILGAKNPISYLIPLPVLFFYLMILEFPYTLVRAYIFYSIYVIQMIFHKKGWVGDLLINTLIILIFLFPFSVFNLSVLFSFLSVGGILVFYDFLKNILIAKDLFPYYNRKEKIKLFVYRYLVSHFLITFCATIFLQPVILFVFKGYSLLTPIYNMIFVPYVGFLLPFLFFLVGYDIFSLAFPYFSNFSIFLWNIFKFLYDLLIEALEFFYQTVLWSDFSYSFNIGFIISMLYLIFFLSMYVFVRKKSYDVYQFKNIFYISYMIYQSTYLFVYLYEVFVL